MNLVLARHVSAIDTDRGMVLLDQRSGRYWQLNETAAAVVRALSAGRPPDDAVTALHERYPEHAERVGVDVESFVRSLRNAKLVTG